MKKYLRIALLVVVGLVFVGTFVFLYQKSRPEKKVYETVTPQVTDLEKTTVATGKVEPRDEVLIKPQISGRFQNCKNEKIMNFYSFSNPINPGYTRIFCKPLV